MQKRRFESYSSEFQLLADTLPMLVSVTKNPADETDEQYIVVHDRFLSLDHTTKDKLAAIETSEKIQTISKDFKLNLSQMSDIARAIRSYYFGELKLEDMPFVLAKEMNVDLTKAKEISKMVIDEIINDSSYEKAYQDSLEKLTIPEALKSYPEVGEQLITGDRIKIKNFPEPARPSLKNWLADYIMITGREERNAVKRGNYLFQSDNGKSLSTFDRQRLSYILKCLDENIPVSISKTTKQILFPQASENNFSASSANVFQKPIEPKNNIQSVQFSYSQKPQNNTVIIPKKDIPTPKNLVNLKD